MEKNISLPKRQHKQVEDRYPCKGEQEGIFYLWLIFLWISCLLYFNPRLLALTYAAPNLLGQSSVVVFTLCLNIFWLYMLYHVMMIGGSIFLRKKEPKDMLSPLKKFPPVAVLYPTRNDFREASVESCLKLDYPHCHLYILDDSTLEVYKNRIEQWASSYTDAVTIIRRDQKKGYKAGNLNHALHKIKAQYPYFVICDADGILPSNFIKDLMPYFDVNEYVAFVQAAQEGNPQQQGEFPLALSFMIEAHYRYYVRAKNRFGFVMFYGHGGLLKTSAWEEVGGFPEIATEDLAYSVKLREKGYYGIYTENVCSYEDFPDTLQQYRTRTEKWIRGTSEFLKLYYSGFFRSKKVFWYEKVDVLVSALSHYQPFVMLVFLIVLGTLLPVYFDHFRYPGSFFLMPVPYGKSVWEYLIHIRYHIFWSFDFYAVMISTIAFPVFPALFRLHKDPRRLFSYLIASNYLFLSSLVVETWDFVIYLLTKKAVFRNTFDAAIGVKNRRGSVSRAFYHPNHTFVFLSEVVMALFLLGLCVKTKNLWFLAPASALLMGPLLCCFGWQNRFLKKLSTLPFLVTLLILLLVTLDLVMMFLTKV